MNSPNISVVIASFNCWHHLKNCLGSLAVSKHLLAEVIVIDNASVDGTVEKLRKEFPQVRVIENPSNVGHTGAVNQGMRETTADLVLVLDADTELWADAIEYMASFLGEHLDSWMVAPRTLNTDGTLQETARNFPSAINGLFGRRSILTRLFPNNRFSRKYLGRGEMAGEEPFRVQQISAACMLFRREVLSTVGMWDEAYTGYWVDSDWCKRIQAVGGVIYCVPRAVVTHHEQNKPFMKKSPERIIAFHRGAQRFYRLHYTSGRWDPRSLLAAGLLATRAAMLIGLNTFKKSSRDGMDPLSER
ncbi:MAG: glycosyltransferase family 2 protein [Candidatus Krumholzibacteriia bacterium]